MAISASQLIGLVEIRGATESIAKLEGVGRATDSAGAKLTALAVGGVLIAGAALVALGAKAVTMAGDFEQSITKLFTTAGEQQNKLKMVGQGILDMSVQVGTGAQELATAMYIVESGGYHGAAGLDVLKIAAEGARAENANVTDVAKAVVFALNAYRGTTLSAAQAMNILVAATGSGTATLQDFAVGLPNVLPVAAKFHISLTDIAAGMAVMTAQGDDASSAATHLRQVILAIEAPTKAGTKALNEIGLTTQQVSDAMSKSLPGAIQMITDDLGKKFPVGSTAYNEAIKAIAGGNKQLLALLELSGPQLKAYQQDVSDITGKTKEAGNSILGWAAIQDTFNFKVGQANAALQKLGIDAGNVLLPALKAVLDNVTPLIGRFDDWFVKSGREATVLAGISTGMSTLGNVLGIVAPVIGNIIGAFRDAGTTGEILRSALVALGVAFAEIKIFQFAQGVAGTIMFLKDLIPALGSATVAFGGLDIAMAPLALVIGGIALAAAGAAYAFTHWSDIVKQNDQQVGQYLKDYQTDGNGINAQTETIGGFFSRLGSGVKTTFESMHIGTLGSLNAMVSDTKNTTAQMAADAKKNADQMNQNVTVAAQTMARNTLNALGDIKLKGGQSFDDLLKQVDIDMQQIDTTATQYWADVMHYIDNHPINGHITYTTAGGGLGVQQSATTGHNASGTDYWRGGWSWVGEQGPELANIPRGTQIVPHSQSVGMGSPGGPIQLEVHVYLDKARMGQELVGPIVSAIRTATGAKF